MRGETFLIVLTGVGIAAIAGLPPLAAVLEARLPLHVLVQFPMIIAGGALIGAHLARERSAPWTAAPALLAAMLTLGFWMLPRWVDASLFDTKIALMKVVTLALLAGVPLGWGWVQAGLILRGFLIAHAAIMFAVTGWLLLVVPQRLCNAYLISDQRMLGSGLVILAAGLVGASVIFAIGGRHHRRGADRPAHETRPVAPEG